MRRADTRWGLFVAGPLALLACSPLGERVFTTGSGGAGGAIIAKSTGTGGTTVASSTSGDLGIDAGHGGAGGGGGAVIQCTPGGPNDDVDGDGYTPAQGDFDDCDPNVNPNAVEVPTPPGGVPKDENCDGTIDEVAPPCDTGIAVDEMDPMTALQAVDLCHLSTDPKKWGVVSAKWVLPDGTDPPPDKLTAFHLGHGVLPHLGPNVKPQRGASMLAISSGTAREPMDAGYHTVSGFDKKISSGMPQGFVASSGCGTAPPATVAKDGASIEVVLRTPSNAKGFSFDFNFFTYEWPEFVCDSFNDFFVAMLTAPGLAPKNVSFDSQNHPVSVNNAFVEVCGCEGNPPNPCLAGFVAPKSFSCALGDIGLIGTGFGFDSDQGQDHGSTGWLRTTAPVAPNAEITLLWTVFDETDGIYDTTVLLDNFQWIAKAGVSTATTMVPQ